MVTTKTVTKWPPEKVRYALKGSNELDLAIEYNKEILPQDKYDAMFGGNER